MDLGSDIMWNGASVEMHCPALMKIFVEATFHLLEPHGLHQKSPFSPKTTSSQVRVLGSLTVQS